MMSLRLARPEGQEDHMEYKYRAVFKNSEVVMETTTFRHLYDMVKLTLTSDYIEEMRKPEVVIFYSLNGSEADCMFIALTRSVRSTDQGDVFDIKLHYWAGEWLLRSIAEQSADMYA